MNLPESQASFEARPVEPETAPVMAVPKPSPEIAKPTTIEAVASREPVTESATMAINSPSVDAIASGAQTVDAESTQVVMEKVFEANQDHAA